MRPQYARMVELYSPEGEPQLAVLKSVLDGAGIRFFVYNDTIGSMLAGPRIAHCNRKQILVAEEDLEEARALLSEFLEKTGSDRTAAPRGAYSTFDKLRMVLEFLLFGWIMPGRRPSRPPRLRLVKGFQTGARQDGDGEKEKD